MVIPESVSGTGKGISESYFSPTNVTGKFSDTGMLIVEGSRILFIDEWIINHATVTLKDFYQGKTAQHYKRLHWTDILALVELSKTKGVNPYTKREGFHAGKNNYVYLDELTVIMLIQEIAASDGKKDFNSIIARDFPKPTDDSTQDESPFNPLSPNYNPSKPIMTYDPDNGVIVYKSGEIVWTKTKGQYYDPANGQAISYDKAKQTVLFASGAVLNLVTLELLKVDKQTVIVKNQPAWWQKIMSNTRLLLGILAAIVILIIIKKKRNG